MSKAAAQEGALSVEIYRYPELLVVESVHSRRLVVLGPATDDLSPDLSTCDVGHNYHASSCGSIVPVADLQWSWKKTNDINMVVPPHIFSEVP